MAEATRVREAEWGRRFAALTMAWLGAETLTGLVLWLLPFSAAAQWTVVVHTAVGVCSCCPSSSTSGSTCASTGRGRRAR